jgi:hypothetical protein
MLFILSHHHALNAHSLSLATLSRFRYSGGAFTTLRIAYESRSVHSPAVGINQFSQNNEPGDWGFYIRLRNVTIIS